MLFSFLIPVYNTEKYLRQCIDSLLVQKGADYEILLLDDGSQDGSPMICDDYQAAFPEIVRVIHKENEGLLLTRRRGFLEAAGDWFICMDSDDYATPDLLEAVITAIDSNDGCDMVIYNYRYVDDMGNFSPSRLSIPDGTVFRGETKQQLYAMRLTTTLANNMWMRAVRRDIVDISADYRDCGIRNMCEDALQVLPLYTNSRKAVFLDRPLYCYRKGDSSITSRMTPAHWQAIHRSFALEQPYAEHWGIPEAVSRKRCTRQLENICNHVRWLYSNENIADIPGLVRTMKEESLFRYCLEHYDKKYSSTRYNALSLPVIASAVDQERFAFLRVLFKLENWIRRKRV